jgi:hypothetical protein
MDQQTGWIPDNPDPKDFTLSNTELRKLLFQSQGIQKLATIVQGMIEDLERLHLTLPFVKMSLLKDATVQLIGNIQKLNVEENSNLLSLVPARLIQGSRTESNPPAKRGDTEVQIEDPAKYLTQSGEAAPVLPSDLLYLPILGNCDSLFKDPAQILPPLPRAYQLPQSCRSRVEDQGASRQSCTAHAAIALIEYFEMRRRAANSPHVPGSPTPAGNAETARDRKLSSRFLYKVTQCQYAMWSSAPMGRPWRRSVTTKPPNCGQKTVTC